MGPGTDLLTKQGALSYAERKRAEMVACWHEKGQFEMNGFSYGAWVLGTHEVINSKTGKLADWKTGPKLPRAAAMMCKLPKEFHEMPGSKTMRGHTMQREMFSQALKAMAKLTRAVGVIFCAEAWVAEPPLSRDATEDQAHDQAQAWRDTQPDDMSEIPGRMEALFIQLEHQAAGRLMWRAMISRDPDRVGAWEEGPQSGDARGRMTNLVDWRS